jgi:transcription-repair coupling factor (superfamily II helicase)
LDVYRRIAVARSDEELNQLAAELADVYGPLPDEVKSLLDIAGLRIAAGTLDIKSIVAHAGNLVFSFPADAGKNAKRLFKNVAAKYTVADETTVYLHLPKSYFEQQTLLSFLRKILGVKK